MATDGAGDAELRASERGRRGDGRREEEEDRRPKLHQKAGRRRGKARGERKQDRWGKKHSSLIGDRDL
eukprot:763291-Hanusia_phi.AAC.2